MPKQFKAQLWAQDSGTIAPLIAGYLALIIMVFMLSANVVSATALANRLQGVADLGLIYAHERSLRVGEPQLSALRTNLDHYLKNIAASGLEMQTIRASVLGPRSTLEICARVSLPLTLERHLICKRSSAQSYLIP
jgi:hypothetical protein